MQNFSKSVPTLDDFITECIKICPIVDIKDNVVYLKQPLNSSRVNAQNFRLRLHDLENESIYGGNKSGFSEEFESLQQADGKHLYERKIGCLPENRAKNRFKTILPCKLEYTLLSTKPNLNIYVLNLFIVDNTRIKLLNRSNEPNNSNESDYINANRIVVIFSDYMGHFGREVGGGMKSKQCQSLVFQGEKIEKTRPEFHGVASFQRWSIPFKRIFF